MLVPYWSALTPASQPMGGSTESTDPSSSRKASLGATHQFEPPQKEASERAVLRKILEKVGSADRAGTEASQLQQQTDLNLPPALLSSPAARNNYKVLLHHLQLRNRQDSSAPADGDDAGKVESSSAPTRISTIDQQTRTRSVVGA